MEPQQTYAGKDLYPDVLTKAAVYLRSFALNHCFHNGNKKTALLATIFFLEMNGYQCITDGHKLLRLAKTVVVQTPKRIREKFLKKYFRETERRRRRTAYLDEHASSISQWIGKNVKAFTSWFD